LIAEDAQIAEDVEAITEGRGILPLTSVAPSTTACALPTFWTARHPGTHGMLGTALLLREFASMVDMLGYSPAGATAARAPFPLDGWGIPADHFIPVPSIAEQIADVPLQLLIGYGLFGTGLSRLMHRGVHQHHAYYSSSDAFPRLAEVMSQTRGQRCCVSMYLPTVDTLSHAYGYDALHVKREITGQIAGLRAVLDSEAVRDGRTLVMITADHGHYDAPIGIDMDKDERLKVVREAMRMPFGGDERFGYLYLREGTRAQVKEVFAEHFGDQLVAVDGDAAVAAGLFGTAAHPEIFNRIGDLIVLPRPGVRLVDAARPLRAISIHSGLGEMEMLVPLLLKRL
jgi:predicted AlkP superfamily pyrophosphatase or phosphodiesterase